MTNISHNPTTQRFFTVIDGHTAYLSYQIINDTTLEYDHTIVPSELGGRGVGSALVKFALEYARDNHKKVIPACSFVASYINRHSEYQELLA